MPDQQQEHDGCKQLYQAVSSTAFNQDMTSPMDNSEMMSQMTNMAMVQSLTAMTESLNTSAAVTTQTYAGSLIGQEEVTVAVTDPDTGTANGVKYGKVVSVDFTKEIRWYVGR